MSKRQGYEAAVRMMYVTATTSIILPAILIEQTLRDMRARYSV